MNIFTGLARAVDERAAEEDVLREAARRVGTPVRLADLHEGDMFLFEGMSPLARHVHIVEERRRIAHGEAIKYTNAWSKAFHHVKSSTVVALTAAGETRVLRLEPGTGTTER